MWYRNDLSWKYYRQKYFCMSWLSTLKAESRRGHSLIEIWISVPTWYALLSQTPSNNASMDLSLWSWWLDFTFFMLFFLLIMVNFSVHFLWPSSCHSARLHRHFYQWFGCTSLVLPVVILKCCAKLVLPPNLLLLLVIVRFVILIEFLANSTSKVFCDITKLINSIAMTAHFDMHALIHHPPPIL